MWRCSLRYGLLPTRSSLCGDAKWVQGCCFRVSLCHFICTLVVVQLLSFIGSLVIPFPSSISRLYHSSLLSMHPYVRCSPVSFIHQPTCHSLFPPPSTGYQRLLARYCSAALVKFGVLWRDSCWWTLCMLLFNNVSTFVRAWTKVVCKKKKNQLTLTA